MSDPNPGPNFRRGDLWHSGADLVCVTTNNVLNHRQRELVMGAGIAKHAADRHPGLKAAAYQAIAAHDTPELYGFLPLEGAFRGLALFQTKRHWRYPSTLDLIRVSVAGLRGYAQANPEVQVALPFPGIGMGGLSPDEVRPLLRRLPANVTVWSL